MWTFSVSVSGAPVPALSESGALPTGVTFLNGSLRGIPTALGTFPLTFSASNGFGSTATLNFTLRVVAFAIITTSLPAGKKGAPYAASVSAAGGNPPYVWKMGKGSHLPRGLKLSKSGQITGSPKSSGTISFTIQVSDTKSATSPHTRNSASGSFTLTIS